MKAVELEIIMRDSTREGMQSVVSNVNELSTYITGANALIGGLETSLLSMQGTFARAMSAGIDQTDNIALISVLGDKIKELKDELKELEEKDRSTSVATPTLLPSLPVNYNERIKAASETFEGLNAVIDIAVSSASLLGIEQTKLTQIQAKLQAMLAISNNLQKIATLLDKEGFLNTVLLTKAKNMLTTANAALATSLGISTVAAQALMATLTLGISAAIAGLIWLWDQLSSEQEEAAKSSEDFRNKTADMAASSVTEFKRMSAEYASLGDSMESKQKFVDDNQDAFNRLGVSIKSVAEAENLLKNQETTFIESLKLKAQATATMELAADKYKESIKKMMEAEVMPDKTTAYVQQGTFGGSVAYEVDNMEKTEAKKAAKNIAKAGDVFVQKSLAFSKQANEKLKKAGINPAGYLVKGSIGEIEASISQKKNDLKLITNDEDYARAQAIINAEQAKLDAITRRSKKTPANNDAKERESLLQQAAEAEVKAKQKYEEMVLAAMAEGAEKERAQAELDFKREEERIAKEEEKRIALNKEIAKKGGTPTQTDDQIKQDSIDQRAEAAKNKGNKLKSIDDKQAANFEQQLAPYKSLAKQRIDIEKKYNDDIQKLRDSKDSTSEKDAAVEDAIVVAEEAKATALGELDRIVAEKDVNFRALMAQITSMSLDELNNALTQAEDALQQSTATNGKDDKQTITARAKIAAMKQQMEQLKAENDVKGPDTTTKWKKNSDSIKKCKDEIDNMINSMDFLDESTKHALQSASNIAGGAIAMIDGIQKLSTGAAEGIKAVEKASVILTIVGTAVQMITAIFSISSAAEKKHQQALAEIATNKLAMQREYNLLLLQQSLLMKEATNIFGEQQILKAVRAIDVYRNSLMKYKEELANGEAPQMTFNEKESNDIGRTYKKRLDEYQRGISALSNITIKTGHEKTGLFGWGKGKDIYSGILSVYPDLIDGENKLNLERAKAILNTQTMSDANRATIESLIGLQEQADTAQESLRDYLQETFGSLGDGMLDSITAAIESGGDAWENFGDKGGEVLENLGRQIAYSLFFAKKFDGLQAQLEAAYGSGKSEEEIARDAMNIMGDFYAGIGQDMEAAQAFLENWKTEAGQKGFDVYESEKSSQSGQSGSFTTMSQEQGTKLEGLFTSVQDHVSSIDITVIDISRAMYDASDTLATIARNTAYCYHLEQMAEDISELKRDGIRMK